MESEQPREWTFVFTSEAGRDSKKLDSHTRTRVLEKLKQFRDNIEQTAPIPLAYEWRGLFKLRVGEWRIVYETEIEEKRVIVHCIDKRDKIYKRKIEMRKSN